jgi:hypothetical protein
MHHFGFNALFLIICFIPLSLFGHERVYTIDHSYGDVVAAVERLANEPRTKPFKVPNLPAIIHGKDIIVTTYARPSIRYYSVEIRLEKPLGKLHTFDKQLEVWGKPDKYILRSTIDIGWGRNNVCGIIGCIKQAFLDKAESMILSIEKAKIMKYANRIGTPEVETERSWGLIFHNIWVLGLEIVDKWKDNNVWAQLSTLFKDKAVVN